MSAIDEPVQREIPRAHWERVLFGKRPMLALLRVLVLVVACFLTVKFVALPIRVTGASMEPTYHDGSLNYVNLLSYRTEKPQRGDVVAIRVGPREYYFKRVVGLPGETISLINGDVFINQKLLVEPYVKWRSRQFVRPYELRDEEYFLAGDNRKISVIGASFGTNILGKAIF